MNLKEDIDRIKEVMGINQSNELVPVETNRFVYHKSNPIFRNQIEEDGLMVKGKSETWLSDTPIEGEVIFATNSDDENDWFDSTYDDDIYQIDTTKIDNIWYNDPNFLSDEKNKHIITFGDIPSKAIELIYKGTGEDMETINENHLLPLKRRLHHLPSYVKDNYEWLNPKMYTFFDDFLDRVIRDTTTDLILDSGLRMDSEGVNKIKDLIMKNHRLEILKYYEDKIRG